MSFRGLKQPVCDFCVPQALRACSADCRGSRPAVRSPASSGMAAYCFVGVSWGRVATHLEGKVGQQVHFPNVLRPETLPKGPQTRRLQAITGQVPVRETIMRWYRPKDMDLAEEYMRCHCGRGQETYEHFMRCEQYKVIEEPLVRDQDILLLKKGEKGRRAMERELGKEGHHRGLWHMVIVQSLWRGLQEHTVGPEAVAHRLLRASAGAHGVQEGRIGIKGARHAQSVIKRLEMALIRYNPQFTEMEVRTQPYLRQRQSEGVREVEEREREEQRERLMARRQKRIRQI